MKKPMSSRKLVKETKKKWKTDKFNFEFHRLDVALEDMLKIEKIISYTKKTTALNKLYKKLQKKHNKVDMYVYNNNRHALFMYFNEELDWCTQTYVENYFSTPNNSSPIKDNIDKFKK